MRGPGVSSGPTLSTAAVTLLGLRVTRDQVLRISALLTLRTLVNLIDIPLDDGVQTYLWSLLFSSVQAGVAIATVAGILRLDGILGRIVSTIIPPSADAAFLTLFAGVVVIISPIVSLVESAIVVYYVMSISRRIETSMFRAEASGASVVRPIVILSAGSLFALSFGTIYKIWRTVIPDVYLIAYMLVALLAVIINFVTAEEGNIIEASMLSVYIVLLSILAIVEEATVNAPMLGIQWLRHWKAVLCGDDVRAAMLVFTTGMLLISMSRATHFFRVLMLGYETVNRKESQERKNESGNNPPTDEGQETQQNLIKSSLLDGQVTSTVPGESSRTIVSTVTLLAATFRVLMWARALNDGEYLPLPCRAWQIATVVFTYVVFVRM